MWNKRMPKGDAEKLNQAAGIAGMELGKQQMHGRQVGIRKEEKQQSGQTRRR